MIVLFQGNLGVNVTYGGDSIPKSPFSVAVAPSLDLSKIKVSGLGESTFRLFISGRHHIHHQLLSEKTAHLYSVYTICRTCSEHYYHVRV